MIDKTKMTLQGTVLIVPCESQTDLLTFAMVSRFTQFSVSKDDDMWTLSAPLDAKQQVAYAWLFHKMKGLRKKDKGDDKPTPPTGPKGTPPQGGSPAAGQVVEEQELLLAVA